MHSKVNENVNGKHVVETQTDYLKSHKKCYICEQAIQLINTRDDTWREEPVGLIRLLIIMLIAHFTKTNNNDAYFS